MTENQAAQRSPSLLLLHKLSGVLFDHFFPPLRLLFWPFKLVTRLWDMAAAGLWLLSNEYTKRTLGRCGTGVRIYGRFHVTAPEKLCIGDNVHINTNAFFRAEGGLDIGDNTHISRNLVVYTMNHNYQGRCLPYDSDRILKPVRIGRNVWIGMNVTIVPGVTIGDGAIIGMGAVIARDVPPLAIVGSIPHKILKTRDKAHYFALDEGRKYGGMSGYLWTGKSQSSSSAEQIEIVGKR